MVAPVSPDPEKAQISELLKKLIRERGYTHQSFSDAIGVSPGLVSQWATNRGAVPAERAMKVATLLGTKPEIISPIWRELREQFVASQPLRLDAATITAAVRLASGAGTGVGLSHFELETEDDAELFALAIAEVLDDQIIEASDSDVQRFARKLKSRKEGDDGQVGAAGSNGGTDSSAGQAKAGNAKRAAAGRQRKRA
ncbi:hypothetical protein ABB26_05135 [Stenotrophomonas humi]|uniref:HTH cro/C1-type domain-containing protein n=1 Tax=Stenotrophomonas humi TaxID=405444 RepID=A0A0R0C809_9GAMM|nr:helix-turn-helix transcriptional regulator [Stenotrophomonas humi]KRG65190.1 hypothetical protein ABB26_05135 [Stenotrophomonas humi]